MKIVLLGCDGFLGKELDSRLQVPGNEILLVGRRSSSEPNYISTNDPNYLDQIASFSPEIVINAMAAWGSQTSQLEILEANLLTPAKLFFALSNQPITWIQCNSYYNYTYDEIGIDRDDYSLLRRHFTEMASEMSKANISRFFEIRLPHLVGANQPPEKIIPQLVSSLKSGVTLELGSGNQVIPMLHVSDAARQIIWMAENKNSYPRQKTLFASIPVSQLSIKMIVNQLEILYGNQGNFRFGQIEDRIHEQYMNTKFGGIQILLQQATLYSLEEILLEYLSKNRDLHEIS